MFSSHFQIQLTPLNSPFETKHNRFRERVVALYLYYV